MALACDCTGRRRGLSGLNAAPSWYDNASNEISSFAENLWNDVESFGVWADNELLGPFSAQSAIAAGQADATQSGPLTQFSQGINEAGTDLETAGANIGQGIGNFFSNLSSIAPLILIVGGLVAFAIIEEK